MAGWEWGQASPRVPHAADARLALGRGRKGVKLPMIRVLVVDDSETMRQLVHSMLEPEGFEVFDAADGVQGLEAIRGSDERLVILLDYRMPNMDGYEVLQTVAAAGSPLTDHEYIVISAEASTFPSAYIDLLRQLSIRILPKPFGRDALSIAVAQAAERLATPVAESVAMETDA